MVHATTTMGPRKYMAKRLTDFLLNHGSLNHHVRQIQVEQCMEHLTGPLPVSWWEIILTTLTTSNDPNGASPASMQGRILGHSAIVLISSFIISHELKRTNEWKKKCRLFSSPSSNNSSSVLFAKQIEEIAMFFANSSLIVSWGSIVFVTRNAISSSWVGEQSLFMGVLKRVYFVDRIIGISEEIMPVGASQNVLFASSLWLIVLSALLTLGGMIWNVLDPRGGDGITKSFRLKGWSQRDLQHAAAVSISVGLVLWLAYTDLVLFRMIIHGEIQLTFGLPQGMIQLIKQAFSSFIGFCLFYKFLPNEKIIVEQGNHVPSSVKKRPIIDPAVAERMSKLACEALQRVEARKRGELSPLRRTYSEGNFRTASYNNTPYSTPIPGERRRLSRKNTLSSLPEQQAQNICPESPLMAITLAGPTLSSRDLMAKLKRSSSFTRPAERQHDDNPPQELDVPELDVPVESISLPFLVNENGEEKKVLHNHEDGSSSTPTPLSPVEDLFGTSCSVLPSMPKLTVGENIQDDGQDNDNGEPLSTEGDVSRGITLWKESLPSSSLLLCDKLGTETEMAEAEHEEVESSTPKGVISKSAAINDSSFIGNILVVPSSGPCIISREQAISIGIKVHNSQWKSRQYGYAAKILLKRNSDMVDTATIRNWALLSDPKEKT